MSEYITGLFTLGKGNVLVRLPGEVCHSDTVMKSYFNIRHGNLLWQRHKLVCFNCCDALGLYNYQRPLNVVWFLICDYCIQCNKSHNKYPLRSSLSLCVFISIAWMRELNWWRVYCGFRPTSFTFIQTWSYHAQSFGTCLVLWEPLRLFSHLTHSI